MPPFMISPPFFIYTFLEQGLSLNLEINDIAKTIVLQGSDISISLPPVLEFQHEAPCLFLFN